MCGICEVQCVDVVAYREGANCRRARRGREREGVSGRKGTGWERGRNGKRERVIGQESRGWEGKREGEGVAGSWRQEWKYRERKRETFWSCAGGQTNSYW